MRKKARTSDMMSSRQHSDVVFHALDNEAQPNHRCLNGKADVPFPVDCIDADLCKFRYRHGFGN